MSNLLGTLTDLRNNSGDNSTNIVALLGPLIQFVGGDSGSGMNLSDLVNVILFGNYVG